MRKQFVRVAVLALAAMMLTTSAFAAAVNNTSIAYTGKNKVAVTVGTSSADNQVTLLAVKGGVALANVSNTSIANIDQTKATASAALQNDASAVFEFDTNGPLTDATGKIDVYVGDSVSEQAASVLSVYQTAPVGTIALVKLGTDAIELPNGTSTSDAIKTALVGKAKIVLTHVFEGSTAADTTDVTIDASLSADFAFELVDNEGAKSVKVTYTPGANAEYGVVSGTSVASSGEGNLSVTVAAAPAEWTKTKFEFADATGVSANNKNITIKTDNADYVAALAAVSNDVAKAVGDYVESKVAVKISKYDQYDAVYNKEAGDAPITTGFTYSDGVANSDKYVVTISQPAEVYGGAATDGKAVAPATLTVTVTLQDPSDAVAITGTVQARLYGGEYAATAGAVVLAYDNATNALAGAAVTNAAGEFSIDVEDGKTYTLSVSKTGLAYDDGYYDIFFNRVMIENVEDGAIADPIKLNETYGDTDGNGVTDFDDSANVASFYNTDFTAAE